MPETKAYVAKKLEWEEGVDKDFLIGKTAFGPMYEAFNGVYSDEKFGAYYRGSLICNVYFDTLDEAKAACQSHYNDLYASGGVEVEVGLESKMIDFGAKCIMRFNPKTTLSPIEVARRAYFEQPIKE